MTPYEKWLESLKTRHDERYYENLLHFSEHILNDLEKYKQKYVADRLGLPTPTLSTFKPLLVAFTRMTRV